MGRLLLALVLAVLPGRALAQGRQPDPVPDPARHLVRVEVRLFTDARFASVRVLGNHFAAGEGRRLAGPDDLRTAVLENLLALSGNVERSEAAGAYRVVLAGMSDEARASWSLNVQFPHRARLEIWNLNDEAHPRLVDTFEGIAGAEFSTGATRLREGGPLADPVPPVRRWALAHFYVWYDGTSWADPQMVDQPLRAYSSNSLDDIRAQLEQVRRAGLDGVVVSWQGPDAGGGWNDARLRLVLRAAADARLVVAVQVETLVANTDAVEGAAPEPDILVAWLDALADLADRSPAYLRVSGRPVVFLYAWPFASTDTWRRVLARARDGGHEVFALADSTDPTALQAADGLYTYAGSLFTSDAAAFSTRLALATRTWHLLGEGHGEQRLSVAPVAPGFDERALHDRPLARVVPREDGLFYDRQWQAAVASGADWACVTSWNEWWENTHIEAGRTYGDAYVTPTRPLASLFRLAPRE